MSAVLTVDIPPLHGINGLQATRWPLRRPPHFRDRPLPRIAVCGPPRRPRATATAAGLPRSHRNSSLLRCCDNQLESTQYPIHYTERLAEAGIEPSVGASDSYDNALAETNRPETESPTPLAHLQVESTLEWVDWFNNRRGTHRGSSSRLPRAEVSWPAQLTEKDCFCGGP